MYNLNFCRNNMFVKKRNLKEFIFCILVGQGRTWSKNYKSPSSPGVTEDDITENAITLLFSRTGKSYNQKML
jgi:hypothetical protein